MRRRRARLDAGNQDVARLLANLTGDTGTAQRSIPVDPRDLGLEPGNEGSAPAQRPFAAVLGCSDVRVPIELILNEGPNDLLVVRVAGNGLGSDVPGRLDYAVEHLGGSRKLVVVLTHSGCGAVSAAVDTFLDPRNYLALAAQPELRGILDRLIAVVHATTRKLQSAFGSGVIHRPDYRETLIEISIVVNAAQTVFTQQESPCLRGIVRVSWISADLDEWPSGGGASSASSLGRLMNPCSSS